jgi:hypothetical protein
METYSTENGGSYAGANKAELERIEPTLSSATFPAGSPAITGGGTGYEIKIQGAKSTQLFWVTRAANGEEEYLCEKAGTGGCPPAEEGEIGDWQNG